jgi:hypothetical protein
MVDDDPDWAEFYSWSAGREPRPLLLAACQELGAGQGRMAIRVIHASFSAADLPRAHLIHAGFSLPYCPSQTFPATWARIRHALAWGGVLAGQLFGIRDSWVDDPSMTFHARHEVEGLLGGLQILRLEETEQDGHASSVPNHWHTFDILGRRPASTAGRRHALPSLERPGVTS